MSYSNIGPAGAQGVPGATDVTIREVNFQIQPASTATGTARVWVVCAAP